MDLKEFDIDIGAPIGVPLSEWSIDYKLLRDLAKTRTRTVGSAEEVWQLAQDVAKAVGLEPQIVGVILHFEYDFPARTTYRSAATRDDGSLLYRGITQASMPFWMDVRSHATSKGWNIRASRPENASLFEQIAAPFVYLDRYRKRVESHLFTPAMIYTLHQQGPGAAKSGFANVAGGQSSVSLRAVKAAQLGARGRQVSVYL